MIETIVMIDLERAYSQIFDNTKIRNGSSADAVTTTLEEINLNNQLILNL